MFFIFAVWFLFFRNFLIFCLKIIRIWLHVTIENSAGGEHKDGCSSIILASQNFCITWTFFVSEKCFGIFT